MMIDPLINYGIWGLNMFETYCNHLAVFKYVQPIQKKPMGLP